MTANQIIKKNYASPNFKKQQVDFTPLLHRLSATAARKLILNGYSARIILNCRCNE